jgi:transposase
MNESSIERVDEIPIIFHKLKEIGIQERIDRFWQPHGNWKGLSYGRLAVLFIIYMIHSLNHRLSGMEGWIAQHQHLLEQLTGWTITPKEATDDRLGLLIEVLGSDLEHMIRYQIEQGAGMIQAYALPTEVARFDLTAVNVYHAPEKVAEGGILEFGHSKNQRPDLLQFKQSLGTLDPAGVPLVTMTLKGSGADDPQYFPAWQQMSATIGHPGFLLVGDCKMGALATRLKIARAGGVYLCPLPMTGQVPQHLAEWVNQLPDGLEAIYLTGKKDHEPRRIGHGFEVAQKMIGQDDQGEWEWSERWLVIHSERHAKQQNASFLKRLERAEKAVKTSAAKSTESVADWRARLNKIMKEQGVSEFLTVQVQEKIHTEKRYLRSGRPTVNTPLRWETSSELTACVERQAAAIHAHQQRMGWRIYVTNAAKTRMTLQHSVRYDRDEYLVERGFHRFKGGSLPVLPLFVRIDERIKGLVFLLFMALQILTLMDFVASRELAKTGEKIAGLVPGNPKMAVARPTAERLLAAFEGIHLLVEKKGNIITGYVVEKLSPLQEKILTLLQIPKEIYHLSFSKVQIENDNDPVENDVGLAMAA